MKNSNLGKHKNVKAFLMLFVAFSLAINVFAQPPHGHGKRFEQRSEEIHARRVAFITNKVSLTSEEAQVFWPVYNEYNKKKDELMRLQMMVDNLEKRIEEMSEEEAIAYSEKEINMAEKGAQLRREYHTKFNEILPPKKVALLYMAEKQFNRELFKEVRKRGQRDQLTPRSDDPK